MKLQCNGPELFGKHFKASSADPPLLREHAARHKKLKMKLKTCLCKREREGIGHVWFTSETRVWGFGFGGVGHWGRTLHCTLAGSTFRSPEFPKSKDTEGQGHAVMKPYTCPSLPRTLTKTQPCELRTHSKPQQLRMRQRHQSQDT